MSCPQTRLLYHFLEKHFQCDCKSIENLRSPTWVNIVLNINDFNLSSSITNITKTNIAYTCYARHSIIAIHTKELFVNEKSEVDNFSNIFLHNSERYLYSLILTRPSLLVLIHNNIFLLLRNFIAINFTLSLNNVYIYIMSSTSSSCKNRTINH